jgi:hypothetical protein
VRRVAAVAVVAAAGLALAGCDHRSGPPPAAAVVTPAQRTGGDRPPGNRTQLQALLDRRARALAAGDASAYAATAAGAQRGRDRRAARDAGRLTLRDVSLQLRDARVRGDRATLRAVLSWGIRGVGGTFVSEPRLEAVRHGGGWRISTVSDRRGRPPWELGGYREQRLAHFTLLAPGAAAGLPATLEAGYAAIRRALPAAPLKRRYLVVVAPSATAATALTTDIRGVAGLAAISDAAVHETGPEQRVSDVVSQRLVVIWPAFAGLGELERRRVIAHELTHAVLAGSTSGRTPSWLVEGVALFTSGDRRDDQVAAALSGRAGAEGQAASTAFSLRALSSPGAIARLDGARQAGAYAYASAAAYALAAAHGRRALLRLYDAFNDPGLRGRPGPALVDRALRRTVGETLAGFEARLRAGLS